MGSKPEEQGQKKIYFITACIKDRKQILWEKTKGGPVRRPADLWENYKLSDIGNIVNTAILEVAELHKGVQVDKYVIMPNHIHLLLSRPVGAAGLSIAAVVNALKGRVNSRAGGPIWQKTANNHAVKSEKEYQDIWMYIDSNPQQWENDGYYDT